jgi:hypothetical protein
MSTAELNFKLTRLLQAKGVLVGDICCSKSTVSEDGQVVEIWKDVDFLRQWESREMSQECLPDAFLELISTTATRERYPTNLSYPYLGEVKKNMSSINQSRPRLMSAYLIFDCRIFLGNVLPLLVTDI